MLRGVCDGRVNPQQRLAHPDVCACLDPVTQRKAPGRTSPSPAPLCRVIREADRSAEEEFFAAGQISG